MKLRFEAWRDREQHPYYATKSPLEIHHSEISLEAAGFIIKLYDKTDSCSDDCRETLLHKVSTAISTPVSRVQSISSELISLKIVEYDEQLAGYIGCGWLIYSPKSALVHEVAPPKRPGWVYAMHNTRNGLVKLGRTGSINERHYTLSREHSVPPEQLRVIGLSFVSDSPLEESSLHEEFAEYRVKGTEWFNIIPRLQDLEYALDNGPCCSIYNCFHPQGIVL